MPRLLIQCSRLYKSFGPCPIFEDISLSINEGEVFALIGENGAGKTTLLQILNGFVQPDSGNLYRLPHLTIGLLPQEINLSQNEILARRYIEKGPLDDLKREMDACLELPGHLTKWAELHEEYERLGGYRCYPLEKVLAGLKLESAILDLPMAVLSSGQRVRILLAKLLIENPDLLLLDEPTNHLDQEMQRWLQEFLRSRKGATIIVSHDRKFLNETCNRLIAIKKSRLFHYGGNYDFYLEEQSRSLERQMQAYLAQKEEISMLKQKIKAATFSKRNAPPPSDRNFMAYDRRGEHHQKSQERNLAVLKARLAEIEAAPLPHPKPKSIKGLWFDSPPLSSTVVIEFDHVSKAFGKKVLFSDFMQMLCKGDRIILTGPNGSGKTTLLQCMMAVLPIDSGNIRRTPSAKIAYLDQEVNRLPMAHTPCRYFESRFNLNEEGLRSELHKADLGGAELLHRPFSTLSTGQRKRLMLLSLVLEKPNVLLLDEPTNHLDLLTLEAFEKALRDFEGAILAISHDQTFIDKIATDVWRLAKS